MILLALDTASTLCAACIYNADAGLELGRCVEDIGKGHAERLMDVIAVALAASGKSHADLGAIVVSIGPGSFTGIRVGVSAARGLALALKVPALGVTTLSAMAEEARMSFPGRRILASIDARRDELYVEDHAADGSLTRGPAIVATGQAGGLLAGEKPVLAGSGARVMACRLKKRWSAPKLNTRPLSRSTWRVSSIERSESGPRASRIACLWALMRADLVVAQSLGANVTLLELQNLLATHTGGTHPEPLGYVPMRSTSASTAATAHSRRSTDKALDTPASLHSGRKLESPRQ